MSESWYASSHSILCYFFGGAHKRVFGRNMSQHSLIKIVGKKAQNERVNNHAREEKRLMNKK